MITLITKDNINIILNELTGKWLAFKSKKVSEIVANISIDEIKERFPEYKEFSDKLKIVIDSEVIENTKLIKMNYLILHVSDLCNMRCKYCYAVNNLQNESNLMSSEVMVKSIDKFYQGEDFYVLFHGREPLTNYNEIIMTLEHYKDNNNIHFILQTNGTLLDEEKIMKLKSYNVIINISVDGITNKNNILRSNGIKLDYIKHILELIKKYKISPILIVHKNNYKDLDKISNFLIENKIESASFNFLWPTNDNAELNEYVVPCNELYKTMSKLFDNSIKDGKFIFKERELFLLYGRILKRDIYNYMCNCAPCGAGRNCLSISKNGQIYPCTMVNLQKDNYLGNLDDSVKNIMNKKVVLKDRNIKKIDSCRECPLRIFCRGGGCSGFIYNLTNNIQAKSLYCDYYYNMIIYIMQRIFIMSNEKYFVNY